MAELIDRRTTRTRKALRDALISLILRDGYEAITVQDIVDTANVGRSTFYAHYTGKEDLLRSGFQSLRALLVKERRHAGGQPTEAGGLGFSRAVFEHACEHGLLYRALVGGRGATVAVNELRRLLADLVREDLGALQNGGVLPRGLVIRFVVDTFVSVLTWSLDRRPKLSAEQIDAMFRRLVLHGIGSHRSARAHPGDIQGHA